MRVERNAARNRPRPNAYAYDLSVNELSDLPNYEAQASLVGDFAENYYDLIHADNFTARGSFNRARNITTIRRMMEIMENSGFVTTATRGITT